MVLFKISMENWFSVLILKRTKSNEIKEFLITGDDACACVKSTCFNLRKENYISNVVSDCVTSYDKKRINEMLEYYAKQGCNLIASSVLLTNQ